MDPAHDFFESDAGKFIARAKAYLEAAHVLKDQMVRTNNRMLFAPTLHLTGHGAELLLKGCLIHNGVPREKAIACGHHINKMWPLREVESLRFAAAFNARATHIEALSSGLHPDAAFVDDPELLFEEHRLALGNLHSETKMYPIRYPTEEDRIGPRAPLLVDTLWRTADDYVKRFSEFVVP